MLRLHGDLRSYILFPSRVGFVGIAELVGLLALISAAGLGADIAVPFSDCYIRADPDRLSLSTSLADGDGFVNHVDYVILHLFISGIVLACKLADVTVIGIETQLLLALWREPKRCRFWLNDQLWLRLAGLRELNNDTYSAGKSMGNLFFNPTQLTSNRDPTHPTHTISGLGFHTLEPNPTHIIPTSIYNLLFVYVA